MSTNPADTAENVHVEGNGNGNDAEPPPGDNDGATLLMQMRQMQQLMATQLQLMQMNAPQNPSLLANTLANPSQRIVRQVKVPEGRYHMSLTEYRTYRKDCRDYVFLTQYTDQQVVLQMRLNMDAELKRAVDTNYGELWDRYTVEEALTSIGDIVNETSNPAVYQKEFDGMQQKIDELIREFVTRLKTCSIDCNFVCPYNENHALTDYHIIKRIMSGIYDETLKQEVLQKSETLDTLALIVDYCEHFEAAKKDKETLSNSSSVRISCVNSELTDDEIVAAISTYKKSKSYNNKNYNTNSQSAKPQQSRQLCKYCGYEHGKQTCPAQGNTCNKTGGKNHFRKVCWTKQDQDKTFFFSHNNIY